MVRKEIINGKIECSKCKTRKPLGDFNSGHQLHTKRSQCRNCERDYKMMRRYGLTKEQVRDFWSRDKCELCGYRFTKLGDGKGRHKCVDHDHNTGIARGVLCNACNAAIGYFGDDVILMKKAIVYLNGGGSLALANLEIYLEKHK